MTQIQRLRVTWTGSVTIGGGLSTFYCSTSGDPLAAGVTAFFTSLAGITSNQVSWTIPFSGDLIEDTTGQLTGTWTEGAGTPSTVPATNAGLSVMGVGVRVVWNTGGMTRGRRVRGSTFLTGLTGDSFDGAGAVTSARITTVQNAANTLRSTVPTLRIVSPPTSILAADGKSSVVVSATVPDKVSWLRSRRT